MYSSHEIINGITSLGTETTGVFFHPDHKFLGRTPYLKTMWQATDNPQTFRKLYHDDWEYNSIPISYDYNSMGHRTEFELETLPDEYGLAVGCSFTEGLGLNKNDVYHQNLNIPVYNCGLCSASNEHSLYNLQLFLRKVKQKPKFVIFQLTAIDRFLYFAKNFTENYKDNIALTIGPWNMSKNIKLSGLSEYYELSCSLKLNETKLKFNIETVVTLCELAGSRLILVDGFSQWQNEPTITELDIFDSVFHPRVNKNDKARDGYHPGRVTNKNLADSIMKVL